MSKGDKEDRDDVKKIVRLLTLIKNGVEFDVAFDTVYGEDSEDNVSLL